MSERTVLDTLQNFLNTQRTDFGLKERTVGFINLLRADALAREIREHRGLYYGKNPAIPDAEYDALEQQLRALSPHHPIFAEIGPP